MARQPSNMVHDFSASPKISMPRSSFQRNGGVKTTFDAGYLVPFYVDEALPGDSVKLNATLFGRLATPLHPIMDNLFIDVFFFSVANRLLWEHWVNMNGEQANPGDSTDYIMPTMSAPVGGYGEQSLSDYLGIPTKVENLTHHSLIHRMYNFIWDEWFRDQNLQNSVGYDIGDGPDDPANYVLLKRGKRHDYFTSCLPWAQKGNPVALPLGTEAPIIGMGSQTAAVYNNPGTQVYETGNPTSQTYANALLSTDTGGWAFEADPNDPNRPNVYADLSQATAATVNALREAFAVQKLYERDARGGTRYTEIIRAHFSVVSPDSRLQRPEYLGGSSQSVSVNPVAQTSASGFSTGTADTPQGNLAAIGTISSYKNRINKTFTEHSYIIGLVMLRADLNYQQGLHRMFSRSTRWDFYWPEFSHLGEQPVLNKEIFATGVKAEDDGTFGFQERHAEYRYLKSQITGLFRSNAAQSLDTWHLAQDFVGPVPLNDEFIEEDPPLDRVIAVTTEPHVILDGFIRSTWARPMPMYAVPGLIDHF